MPSVKSITSTSFAGIVGMRALLRVGCLFGPGLEAGVYALEAPMAAVGLVPYDTAGRGSSGPIDTRLCRVADPGAVLSLAISSLGDRGCSHTGAGTTRGVGTARVCVSAWVSSSMVCCSSIGVNETDTGGSELSSEGSEALVRSSHDRCSPRLLRVMGGQHRRQCDTATGIQLVSEAVESLY